MMVYTVTTNAAPGCRLVEGRHVLPDRPSQLYSSPPTEDSAIKELESYVVFGAGLFSSFPCGLEVAVTAD